MSAHRRIALAELLPDVAGIPTGLMIDGLAQDSREVAAGDAFFAIEGFGAHGLRFAGQARAAGAAAILFEPPAPADLPVPDDAIAVPGLRGRMGAMADRFFGQPSAAMRMVGVTGTNGKTSTVQLLAQAWSLSGTRGASIGTLGVGLDDAITPTEFTTPLVLRLHALLAQLKDAGAQAVAMEVSSHALDQGRVDGVHFDVAVFTNLSRDHLDYHGDMAGYGAAKAKLFRWPGLMAAVVNLDDEFGRKLHADLHAALLAPSPPLAGERAGVRGRSAAGASAFDLAAEAEARARAPLTSALLRPAGTAGGRSSDREPVARERSSSPPNDEAVGGEGAERLRVIGLSSRGASASTLRAEALQLDASGIGFDLLVDGETHAVHSPLLGRFNVDNLLAVAGALYALGDTPAQIADTLSQLQPVHGRMNRLGGDTDVDGRRRPLVVIDYAHTPDALEQALASLRGHAAARLICVFGCGGERDRGKRPQMAAIAEAGADLVIVTDDNPRREDGDAIVAGILQGFRARDAIIVQRDRAAAIARGIDEARADDIVLVAGKGHEPYQEIDGVRHPFDDTVVACQALDRVGREAQP